MADPNENEPFLSIEQNFHEEMETLVRSIQLADGFKLFLVVCDEAIASILIILLKARYLAKPLRVLEVSGEIEHLYRQLKSWEPVPDSVTIVSGLSRSFRGEGRRKFLANLNTSRDFFPKLCRGPLLMMVQPAYMKDIAGMAPDFFSIATVFTFGPDLKKAMVASLASQHSSGHLRFRPHVTGGLEQAIQAFQDAVKREDISGAFRIYLDEIQGNHHYLTRVRGKHDLNLKLLGSLGRANQGSFYALSGPYLDSCLAMGGVVGAGEVIKFVKDFNKMIHWLWKIHVHAMDPAPETPPNREAHPQADSFDLVEAQAYAAYRFFLEGRNDLAEETFGAAESEFQALIGNVFLKGEAGFFYREFLWHQHRHQAVELRAERALRESEKEETLLDIGLALLHLGRLAAFPGRDQDLDRAQALLKKALEKLRTSNHLYYIVFGLLECARFHIGRNQSDSALPYLDEAAKKAGEPPYPSLLIDADILRTKIDPSMVDVNAVRKRSMAINYNHGLQELDKLETGGF